MGSNDLAFSSSFPMYLRFKPPRDPVKENRVVGMWLIPFTIRKSSRDI